MKAICQKGRPRTVPPEQLAALSLQLVALWLGKQGVKDDQLRARLDPATKAFAEACSVSRQKAEQALTDVLEKQTRP